MAISLACRRTRKIFTALSEAKSGEEVYNALVKFPTNNLENLITMVEYIIHEREEGELAKKMGEVH